MIEIVGLKKSFNGVTVLKDVNFTVKPHEIFLIIGRSGCGKSVLLKHIIGLIRPDSGHVMVDGQDVCKLKRKELYELRKRFGFVFQAAALFDSMTVEENLTLGLREHYKLPEAALKSRVEEGLHMVGLSGIEKKMPSELSGGMKKRVGLARAVVMRPKYILFDEPTTGLDPIMTDVISSLIIDLNEKLAVTSIVVTHDMVAAYKMADRIGMLYGGEIVASGTAQEMRETDNPLVRQFTRGEREGPIKLHTR